MCMCGRIAFLGVLHILQLFARIMFVRLPVPRWMLPALEVDGCSGDPLHLTGEPLRQRVYTRSMAGAALRAAALSFLVGVS